MIVIHNITKKQFKKRLNEYEVKVNNKLICKVLHNPIDGLPSLLRKAAASAEIALCRQR